MKSSFTTVLQYELRRSLGKISFWLITLSIPLLFIVITLISFFGGGALASKGDVVSVEDSQAGDGKLLSWTYNDESGVINPEFARDLGGKPSTNVKEDIASVQAGKLDAVFTINKDGTQITGKAVSIGMFDDTQYPNTIAAVMKKSVDATSTDIQKAVLGNSLQIQVDTYKDGKPLNYLGEALIPGIFVVLLYFTIALTSNYALNSTLEEKENRVSEIIFTTISPLTLLMGKFISIFVLVFVQMLIITGVSSASGYLLFRYFSSSAQSMATLQTPETQALADISASTAPTSLMDSIVFNPVAIVISILAFFCGVFIIVSMLSFVGSIVGSAKDAGQVVGLVMIGSFVPVMALSMVISGEQNGFITFMQWFPLSQPMTTLLRNAVGAVSPVTAIVSSLVTLAVGVVFILGTIRIFKSGSLEYQGMSLRNALGLITKG